MTPEAAARVLEVVVDDETGDSSDLRPLERRFAEEYFGGEFAHNGTKSYMVANPNANYNTASIECGIILKLPRVRSYLRELHQRMMDGLPDQLSPWLPLAVKAQRLLGNHLDGVYRLTGTDLLVIREVLDRAVGKPKETLEHDIGDRISKIIIELAGQRPSRYVRPEPRELLVGATLDNGGSGERSE